MMMMGKYNNDALEGLNGGGSVMRHFAAGMSHRRTFRGGEVRHNMG